MICPPSKATVTASHFITGRWYVLIAVVAGLIYAFKRWKGTDRGREQWDRFKLKIPWKIGGIVQKVALARFSRTYSALVGAGVPMLEAIEITGRTAGNKVVERAMEAVRESVQRGGTIAEPMRSAPEAFPPMVVQMIGVGEDTGALDAMLDKISDFYDQEVRSTTEQLTSMIEPIMIAVLGAIVGSMVIALYMPIFKVFELIN